MADVTTEVCDGRPSYVEEHIDEYVTTVKRYCPWGARLVRLRFTSPGKDVPPAPSGLRVVSVTKSPSTARETTVALHWSDNARNETAFKIRAVFSRRYGGTDSQATFLAPNRSDGRVTFIAGGINPVMRACFTVSALTTTGQSQPSNRACIRI
jgi:hypothetical protein